MQSALAVMIDVLTVTTSKSTSTSKNRCTHSLVVGGYKHMPIRRGKGELFRGQIAVNTQMDKGPVGNSVVTDLASAIVVKDIF